MDQNEADRWARENPKFKTLMKATVAARYHSRDSEPVESRADKALEVGEITSAQRAMLKAVLNRHVFPPKI
jgi:hypothetical protein